MRKHLILAVAVGCLVLPKPAVTIEDIAGPLLDIGRGPIREIRDQGAPNFYRGYWELPGLAGGHLRFQCHCITIAL